MKKLVFCLVIISLFKQTYSQTYTHLPIRSNAPIPSEILESFSERAVSDIKKIDKSDKKITKKDKSYFYYQSNFHIDELLRSGKVVFNNDLYFYLNQVASNIIEKSIPELKGTVKVFPVKSPVVNAYATDKGIIFINTALLAYLQNEAQLAFVISHEIAHVIKRHNVNFYVTSRQIDREKNKFTSLSDEDARVVEKNSFSREQEIEADDAGFEIFSKTGYRISEAAAALEILRFSDLTYQYALPFEKSFFEMAYFKFPDIFFKDDIKPAYEDTSLSEEYKTHPSIQNRINNINSKNKLPGGDNLFIVSQKQFEIIRQICLHEQLIQLIKYRDFIPAIYHGFLLLHIKDYDSLFVQKNIARALVGITLYYNSGKYSSVVPGKDKIPKNKGELSRVYYLFNHMKAEDINLLCIKYSWLLKQKYPEDPELEELCKSAIQNYKQHHLSDLSKVKDAANYNDSAINASYNLKSSVNKNTSKKSKRVLNSQKSAPNSFSEFALSDLKYKTEFITFFNNVPVTEENSSDENTAVKNKSSNRGVNNRMVIADPEHFNVDLRRKYPINFPVGEQKKNELRNNVLICAQKANADVEMWDSKKLTPDQIELFNDIAIIKERSLELDINGGIPFPPIEYTSLNQVIDKYGLNYVCEVAVISVAENKDLYDIYYPIMLAAYLPVFAPFSIYSLASVKRVTVIYMNVYNIKTGESVYEDIISAQTKDHPEVIKSHLYNLFLKMQANDVQ